MQCQHDEGDICIICDSGTNMCCGEGQDCDECGSVFCSKCKDGLELNEPTSKCPRCRHTIITDSDLVAYFLAKAKISRKTAEERYRKWIIKNL